MRSLKERLVDYRKAFVVILAIIIVSPVFVWAAEVVGYSEPLENVAEQIGALEHGYAIVEGLIPDYAIPGFNPYVSSIVAGVVGCFIVLVLGLFMGKLLER